MQESIFTINVCAANVYQGSDFDTPVLTQALMGESCPILEEREKWVLIRQADGYKGWVNRFYGISMPYEYKPNLICDDVLGMVYANPGLTMPLRELTFGSAVKGKKMDSGWYITLPDGTHGWTKDRFRREPRNASRENVVKIARRFLGVPYLWGGRSPQGFDCSGLVQTVFKAVGVDLPRDSKDQSGHFFQTVIDRENSLPGDLHFFGRDGIITHVAMETGGGQFIHSRGWVKEESFHAENPQFSGDLKAILMHSVSAARDLNS